MNEKKAGRCNRCGRPLSNLKSIVRGYGPTCWGKLAQNEKLEKFLDKGEEDHNDYPELVDYFDQLDNEYKCICGKYPIKYGDVDHYEHIGGYPINGYVYPQWIFVTCQNCGKQISFRKLGIKEI